MRWTGVSSSSGEVPTSVEEMAEYAAAFTDALGIKKLDALGFSMGGFIAQQFTIDPDAGQSIVDIRKGFPKPSACRNVATSVALMEAAYRLSPVRHPMG